MLIARMEKFSGVLAPRQQIGIARPGEFQGGILVSGGIVSWWCQRKELFPLALVCFSERPSFSGTSLCGFWGRGTPFLVPCGCRSRRAGFRQWVCLVRFIPVHPSPSQFISVLPGWFPGGSREVPVPNGERGTSQMLVPPLGIWHGSGPLT